MTGRDRPEGGIPAQPSGGNTPPDDALGTPGRTASSADGRGPSGRTTPSEDGLTSGERLAAAVRHRSPGPGGRSLAAALLLHGALAAAVLISGGLLAEDLPEFETMRVRIVSPPPVAAGEPATAPPVEALVVPDAEPETEPPLPEPPKPEPKTETPKPEPRPPETSAAPPPPEPKKEPEKQSTGDRPDPKSQGGENINVVQDGQDFPFPDYLNNIVRQLYLHMRWDGAPDLEVGLVFAIERDGSIQGVDITRRSGNPRFDLAAVNAVNVAARNGRFGTLPGDFAGERLWVRFTFEPQK